MYVIQGIQAVANQTLQATVNNQETTFNIYQLSTGLYMDVYINNSNGVSVLIRGGTLCEDRHVIIRRQYLGYTGDFTFADQQGTTDPFYTGLGTRYVLFYLFPDELPPGLF